MPALTPIQPTPRSSHTSDPLLQPFLGPTFDPTAYLNNNLPPLAIATPAQPILPAKSLSITDLAARTQTHIATLNAQSARLTATLTALTDEILRGGSRLAYAVELLRGEAGALNEVLAETLAKEVAAFVPGGSLNKLLEEEEGRGEEDGEKRRESEAGVEDAESEAAAPEKQGQRPEDPTTTTTSAASLEPAALARLRTLHLVRQRLQSVIHTFDFALSWPLPPSALGNLPSLMSISAPAAPSPSKSTGGGGGGGGGQDGKASQPRSLEDRGQEAQRALRESVMELLEPGGRSAGAEGVLKAEERVEELRELARVWKGTAEEKVRGRFVEGLARIVAERRREEEGRGSLKKGDGGAGSAEADADRTTEGKSGGLLEGLRRLGAEIYLE